MKRVWGEDGGQKNRLGEKHGESQSLIPYRSFNICLPAPKSRQAAATRLLIRAVINHSSGRVSVCVRVCVCLISGRVKLKQ